MNGKDILRLFVGVLLGAIVFLLVFLTWQFLATRAEATSYRLKWGQWSNWTDWSKCEIEEDHQCGVVEGEQTRTRTRTCTLQPSSGTNQCSYIGQQDVDKQTQKCEVELDPCIKDQCDNLEGVQEEVPEGYHQVENDGLECVPDEQPTPEPTATPPAEPQTPPTFQGSTTEGNRPVCNGVYAEPAVVLPNTGVKSGENSFTLNWWPSTSPSDKQVLLYGSSPDSLDYSVNDIRPDVGVFTVNDAPWQHAYYKVGTWRGECISWSQIGDP